MNRYFKNQHLKDKQIVQALRQASQDYENGEISEVSDTLMEILDAIKMWETTGDQEQHSANKDETIASDESKGKQILDEVKNALPNMSEVEEKIALNLISDGYDTDDIIYRICFDDWFYEYIGQVMHD